jgi:DNA modification methylase
MTYHVINADARETGLPDAFFHCVATSPPYFGLREYGEDDREIGDEKTPSEYVAEMVKVGREVRRVMRDDGVWWLNLGDSYASTTKGSGGKRSSGLNAKRDDDGTVIGKSIVTHESYRLNCGVPSKSLLMIPQRVALALQDDGWIVRAQIPWVKASAMPESVRDRPTVAHEYVFQLVKQPRYFWDPDAVRVANSTVLSGGRQYRQRNGTLDISRQLRDLPRTTISGGRQTDAADNPNGRNIRTSDFFHAGLDELQAHIAHVRENGGMMLSDEGDPLAFLVNPAGSKLAHFAMWPPKLVKPRILSSTSEKGCCLKCGAQWIRVVEKERRPTRPGNVLKANANRADAGNPMRHECATTTLGFSPSCECNAGDPIPCRVLDPFAGSGTTLQVCEALGRDSWGVELMAKNIPIIDERMKEKLDPDTMKRADKRTAKRNGQRSIFEEVA